MSSSLKLHPQGKMRLRNAGFALIATISILTLVVMIALAMVSLANTTSRSHKLSDDLTEARANARIALTMAIAQLQLHLGPDQRITANASILENPSFNQPPKQPYWMGVWDSWKAQVPIPGKAPQQRAHSTILGKSDQDTLEYEPGRAHFFRRWMVSLPDFYEDHFYDLPQREARLLGIFDSIDANAEVLPSAGDQFVKLVKNSTSSIEKHVVAPLRDLKKDHFSSGKYAWWVGDQSQKGLIQGRGTPISSLPDTDYLFRRQSHPSLNLNAYDNLEGIAESDWKKLLSLSSIDVPGNLSRSVPIKTRPSASNFHELADHSASVLSDVREGGLKKDLSVILSNPIRVTDADDTFMLYRFREGEHGRVPIQDLSAYYQLYHNDLSWGDAIGSVDTGFRRGLEYSSIGPLIKTPNLAPFGKPDQVLNRNKYLRAYTTLYRQPVPIKIQFILAAAASEITREEREFVNKEKNFENQLRNSDTHKLIMGIMPVVTFWNPTNMKMLMEVAQRFKMCAPPIAFSWKKYRKEGDEIQNGYLNFNSAMGSDHPDGRAKRGDPHILNLRFAKNQPIEFQPGEVKIFSIDTNDADQLLDLNLGKKIRNQLLDPINEWNPYGFSVLYNSAIRKSAGPDGFRDFVSFSGSNYRGNIAMVFKKGDKFSLSVGVESPTGGAGRQVSRMNETHGAAFQFYMSDETYGDYSPNNFLRQNHMLSRYGGDSGLNKKPDTVDFSGALMSLGFPSSMPTDIPFFEKEEAIDAYQLISASSEGEVKALFEFSLTAACESTNSNNVAFGGGRKFPTRPFLHSNILSKPIIASINDDALYDYGWSWHLDRINTVEDSIISGTPSGNGYYGGGYGAEFGTTRVIQQEIPITPPISIASLSHAHLGGYSLAKSAMIGNNPETDRFSYKSDPNEKFHEPGSFRRTLAIGQGGLAPSVLQAIGNSYAHPNIPANKSFTMRKFIFDVDIGEEEIPFVDHSYLANKALYDEYFFSSIANRYATNSFDSLSADKSSKETAEEFFFNGTPLPNQRFTQYSNNLTRDQLETYFSTKSDFEDGLADKIAQHLLVKGSINVNSTSEKTWQALLLSLADTQVRYLDENGILAESNQSSGVLVSPGMIARKPPLESQEFMSGSPNSPGTQWSAARILTVSEIKELSHAIVKQIKLRGPFLSLSEFINRRLDKESHELSLKGALQAAIDATSINKGFLKPDLTGRQIRALDKEVETIKNNFEFPQAAEGPIAYGSAPYIDQADILRNFAAAFTPRGDTFIIRTYGDSRDKDGNVLASAWCEAVVQRTPEYINDSDQDYKRQSELTSAENLQFGRKIKILKFRWLNQKEV